MHMHMHTHTNICTHTHTHTHTHTQKELDKQISQEITVILVARVYKGLTTDFDPFSASITKVNNGLVIITY